MTTRVEVFRRVEGMEIEPIHRQLAEFVLFQPSLARAMWFYNLGGIMGLTHRIAALHFKDFQDMGLVEPYPSKEKPWAMILTARGCLVINAMNEIKKGACYVERLL